jgi:hypothetical protein
MEYVARIDGILEALLSRESLNQAEQKCRHCHEGHWAVWRCRDCSLGVPMCRGCMRASHAVNPFHRIERWNGSFFQTAHLWEVGTYLLVPHHVGTPLCENLKLQMNFLETGETAKDNAEQTLLQGVDPRAAPAPAPAFSADNEHHDVTVGHADGVHNDQCEEEFMQYLQDLLENGTGDLGDAHMEHPADFGELEDELEQEEVETPIINQYLPSEVGPGAGKDTAGGPPSALPFIGTYLRVVHSNGIHDIAMVSCECRGHNMLHCDLLAARLLPASFQRIRTLFTVELLDHFRLFNLELKASAYQFYQLLR